ncbi:MAG: 3-phosphoserine/phosphohydroxythreonine transaminase [Deltaproteobacteria bacterium]|nr:MAG: 3-phosphoserine/phosphohydroxythreonine transaminase [Deltaproteobacteria bacterium]
MRIHNFSAGPGALPEPVLRAAQDALWEHGSHGIGIAECSHRSPQFEEVLQSAKSRLKTLMSLGDDQHVLFLQGGARQQFYQIPMNVLRGGRATYLDTGTWSAGAIDDARRYGTVDVGFSSREQRYHRVPTQGEWGTLPEGTVYLHYTSNNTVAGTEYHYVPDAGDAMLVCDMSSDILSRPVDGSGFDLIYAGAQKNMGPSGVTVVVVSDRFLAACDDTMPGLLHYPTEVKKDSMLNTPNTFGIFVIDEVLGWVLDQGLDALDAKNGAQADAIYGLIDELPRYRGLAEKASRSRMNVTFTTGDAALDTLFWKQALEEGLSGLKGHRSVGGLRASLYNAQTDAAVEALASYMRRFAAEHGEDG